MPPTFSRTHLPGTAPGGGAELHRRQGPPGPRPPIGATGKSQWFSAAILAAGRVRPAYGSAGAPPPEASTSARGASRPAARRGPRAPARRHAAPPPLRPTAPLRTAGSWIAAPPAERRRRRRSAAQPPPLPVTRRCGRSRRRPSQDPTCLYYRLPSISEIHHPVTSYTSTAQRSVGRSISGY